MATPLFPKTIDLDDASIQQLQLLFTAATSDLNNYIFTLHGKVISRAAIMAVRQQTQQRIQQLGNDVGNWIQTAVPQQYVQGQQDAARQQKHFGNDEAAGLILGAIAGGAYAHYASQPVMQTARIINPKPTTFDLQQQSLQTIMDDMSRSFGNTLTYMSRSTDGIISKIQSLGIRKMIAAEAQNGVSEADITAKITDLIESNGIFGLVDKAGRQWSPDDYADMLVRTKMVEARNNGLMNSLLSVGQDLVMVSSHGATDKCREWEGRILSIAGGNELYPSVADAYAGGLFHPRCKHSLNSVNPALYPSGKPSGSLVAA